MYRNERESESTEQKWKNDQQWIQATADEFIDWSRKIYHFFLKRHTLSIGWHTYNRLIKQCCRLIESSLEHTKSIELAFDYDFFVCLWPNFDHFSSNKWTFFCKIHQLSCIFVLFSVIFHHCNKYLFTRRWFVLETFKENQPKDLKIFFSDSVLNSNLNSHI